VKLDSKRRFFPMSTRMLRRLMLAVAIALAAAYYVGNKNGVVYGVIMFPIVATMFFYLSSYLQMKDGTQETVEEEAEAEYD
jgi:dolichyl-phosphate-mannose--protein O-mannosyl transferase